MICLFFRHKGQESKEIVSFTDIANDLESDTYTRSSGLSFDPRDYRAKKEVLNTEIKSIRFFLGTQIFQ